MRNTDLMPAGETAKTEAWVVLEAGEESRIYAGLKPGTSARQLCGGLSRTERWLTSLPAFTPKPGDAVFLPAGTVHSLGGDVVVFEIQENSDVTFRLYDWNHVDAKTGQPRALQVDQAMACIDFARGSGWSGDASGGVINARRTREAVSIVNISGCGACVGNRRSTSALAGSARAGMHRGCGQSWSTKCAFMPSEKATYFSCRQ